MFHVFVYEGLGSAENLKIKVTQRYQFVVIRGGNILNMRWIGCWLTSWISSWEVWRKVGTGYFWAGWRWTESFLLISLGRGIGSKRDILRPRDCRWLRSNGSQGLGFEAHIEIEWILCPSLKHKSFNFLNTNPWMVDCPGLCFDIFSFTCCQNVHPKHIHLKNVGNRCLDVAPKIFPYIFIAVWGG